MVEVLLVEIHTRAGSLDGGTSPRRHTIPAAYFTIRVGAPCKSGNDAPLIIQYGVWRPMQQEVDFIWNR
jgi:hypothetical protein